MYYSQENKSPGAQKFHEDNKGLSEESGCGHGEKRDGHQRLSTLPVI